MQRIPRLSLLRQPNRIRFVDFEMSWAPMERLTSIAAYPVIKDVLNYNIFCHSKCGDYPFANDGRNSPHSLRNGLN